MNKKMRGNLMLLVTALIWGTAFVAQSAGMDHVEPFTYNGIRTLIGGLVLIPVILFFDRIKPAEQRLSAEEQKTVTRNSVIGGVFCGLFLFVASSFQQFGISMTTAGKAGFITALYIVLVPIAGLFLKKKAPRAIWLSVALAVAGLYFLSINEEFHITQGDFLMLLCALCFTGHIMVIDHFTQRVNGIELSCMQFLFCALLSGGGMVLTETPTWAGIVSCAIPLLYVGILSSGVAYTLQILAQKGSNPTVVSLLMSLESVFATVFGALILHEMMSGREIFGCGLMLVAVVLAQLPASK